MPERTASAPTRVEDHLGPAQQRFFGAGYRRVHHTFAPTRIIGRADGHAESTGAVTLSYPSDWSRKTAGDLVPHLSTVDALLLSVTGAELLMACALGLTEPERRRSQVRQARIRAGRRPDDDLRNIPLHSSFRSDPDSDTDSRFNVRVGSMRVELDVTHPPARPGHPGDLVAEHPDEVLGASPSRYYGTGFTGRAHRLEDLLLDRDSPSAQALVQLDHLRAVPRNGLEGALQPAPTLVDCFVTGLQLAQILLYRLDGMERGQSNTLWMRQTVLRARPGPRSNSQRLPLTTALADEDLLAMGSNSWRTARIHAELDRIELDCDVTHRLN